MLELSDSTFLMNLLCLYKGVIGSTLRVTNIVPQSVYPIVYGSSIREETHF
jgi:hypothetical protein